MTTHQLGTYSELGTAALDVFAALAGPARLHGMRSDAHERNSRCLWWDTIDDAYQPRGHLAGRSLAFWIDAHRRPDVHIRWNDPAAQRAWCAGATPQPVVTFDPAAGAYRSRTIRRRPLEGSATAPTTSPRQASETRADRDETRRSTRNRAGTTTNTRSKNNA